MARTSAERSRRSRARRRAGFVHIGVDVSPAVIEWLIEGKWLPAWDDRDSKAIGTAVSVFLTARATRDGFKHCDLVSYDSDTENEVSAHERTA